MRDELQRKGKDFQGRAYHGALSPLGAYSQEVRKQTTSLTLVRDDQRALRVCGGGSQRRGVVLETVEEDCPREEKYSLVSRENLQGKGPEVGTSWFVFEQGKEGGEAKLFQEKEGGE